jgi:hypothetical protein
MLYGHDEDGCRRCYDLFCMEYAFLENNTFLNTCISEARMPRIVFKKVCVLGEQYLLEQHLIRTMDGEDAVPKGIHRENSYLISVSGVL